MTTLIGAPAVFARAARVGQHRRDAVAVGAALRLGAQRDGNHRQQRSVRQLAAVLEPGPQRAGADGYDDVVDGDAEVVLDLLDLVE